MNTLNLKPQPPRRIAPWGLVALAAVALAAMLALSGCANKELQALRNGLSRDVSGDQKTDATTQFDDDTKQLLWDIEYRLGSAARIQRGRMLDIDGRYNAALAAAETVEQAAAVTNAYRDERAAQEAEYRDAVEKHVAWATQQAAIKYSNYSNRMKRAQDVLDLDAAADADIATAKGIIDGVLESTEFRELWALVLQKAAPWINESGADVPPVPDQPETTIGESK